MSRATAGQRHIGFCLAGGPHQFLHIVPVAASLSHLDEVRITAFVNNEGDASALRAMLDELGAKAIMIAVMRLPDWLEQAGFLPRRWRQLKLVRLLAWASAMRRCDAILAADRTTTILKRLPGHCPPLIHLPHGSGDRAKGFEPRLRRFDHIIVSGESLRQRMIDEGLSLPEACTVCGSIKVSAIRQIKAARAEKLFANDRPTILYNAHFAQDLSSWVKFASGIIDAVVDDGRYNLVVAPHVRMFEGATKAQKQAWTDLAIPGRVIVDLDSPRLMDMSYTLGSDIYLGDVSSQIYEFLSAPRPCVFADAHGVAWAGDPNYAHWRYGEVGTSLPGIMEALFQAQDDHGRFAAIQADAIAAALGNTGPDVADVAAQQVLDAIGRLNSSPQ